MAAVDEEKKKLARNDYINNGLSLKKIKEKYGYKSLCYIRTRIIGDDDVRSISEAGKLAHKLYPNCYKHSEEAKLKMRNSRLKFMKEHPEKTAWRQKTPSYIERKFEELLKDKGLDQKFLVYREYSVFPYYIDFAFIDLKIAVELDGSQHLLKERKERDEQKDKLLLSKGWRIIRFTAKEILSEIDNVYSELINFIGNKKETYKTVGILEAPKTYYEKVKRNENGLSEKQIIAHLKSRKVERPSKEELIGIFKEIGNFTKLGKMFGVSDNAISKWFEWYGLPNKVKDLNDYLNR